jgi:DNA repair protein RadA/Sms
VCSDCRASAPRWAGRCPGCGEWNTLVESAVPTPAPTGFRRSGGLKRRQPDPAGTTGARLGGSRAPVKRGEVLDQAVLLSAVDPDACEPVPTGVGELDRVLSGGLVPGSVTLIGGEPGIGKSTLLLQAAASAAGKGLRTLLVAAEESAEQVRRRAERLGALVDNCYIVATGDLPTALEAVGTLQPGLLIVDSIQTIGDPSLTSQVGSTTQVRECAQALAHYAKATGTATVLVGHVTKDGALAGPRTLEHLVDTVLSFEGDRHHSLRHLSATKHRYGTTGEIGLFEMAESGLVGLVDPSAVLLADRHRGVAGSVVAPVIEGRRPLLVEVQALVGESHSSAPRRVVQGIPPARLALLLAVLERSVGISVRALDVFVSTVGGIKVAEPASDLAVALALVSAVSGVPIPEKVVAFGEIGLGGEVRQSSGAERRLSEASRLGFDRAIVPASTPQPGGTLEVVRVATVAEAVSALALADARSVTSRRDRARTTADNARSGTRDQAGGLVGRSAASGPSQAVAKPRIGLTVVRD